MAVDDPVQPPEGQGGESQENSAPWAEYLDRITDEEARGVAEEGFKAFDANTTRKFMEAAEYRKQWEPLEALGVNQRDPAEIEWALQVADAATQSPADFQKWVNGEYAQANGLTPQEQQQLENETEYIDPAVQSLQQRLEAQAQEIQELSGWRSTQEQQAAEQAASAQIESQLSELETKHPDEYDREKIDMLLPKYIYGPDADPSNAVEKAFKDWQGIRAQIEKATLQGKVDTPPGAESGGSANGTEDPPPRGEYMKWAQAKALEQLRGANRS